jgi:hypothetical protein
MLFKQEIIHSERVGSGWAQNQMLLPKLKTLGKFYVAYVPFLKILYILMTFKKMSTYAERFNSI